METTHDDELLARRSHFKVDGTGAVTDVPHYGFQPTQDTIIDAWVTYDSNGNSYDMVDRFGIGSKTIGVDDAALIIPPEMRTANKHSFTLASGAGNLLRK